MLCINIYTYANEYAYMFICNIYILYIYNIYIYKFIFNYRRIRRLARKSRDTCIREQGIKNSKCIQTTCTIIILAIIPVYDFFYRSVYTRFTFDSKRETDTTFIHRRSILESFAIRYLVRKYVHCAYVPDI